MAITRWEAAVALAERMHAARVRCWMKDRTAHLKPRSVGAEDGAVVEQGQTDSDGRAARLATPVIKISDLRTIGWSEWDPLRLNRSDLGCQSSELADEYDSYLVRVARGLQDGELQTSLVDYLVAAETYHMGRSLTSDTRIRARATVVAIRDYLARTN